MVNWLIPFSLGALAGGILVAATVLVAVIRSRSSALRDYHDQGNWQ